MSPAPKKDTEPQKSEAQIHYESLITFLKYTVGITGTLIAVIVTVALSLSYKDRQSMNDENDKVRNAFNSQMATMQTDAHESRTELESRYNNELGRFDKSINEMKADAMVQQTTLGDKYKQQIEDLRITSKDQVSNIVSETRKAATEQTQKEIAAILQTDRVQKIIEQNAIGELKDKLPTVMATYMRDLPQILEAAGWFDGGMSEGESKLREMSKSEI